MIINALGWFLYLFGYEFLFRGVLLFPLVESLGVSTNTNIKMPKKAKLAMHDNTCGVHKIH